MNIAPFFASLGLPSKSNLVEVLLRGGLGNQLFGYASGLQLASRTGLDMRLVTSMLGDAHSDTLRLFELRELLSEKVTAARKGTSPRFREQSFAFDARFEDISGPTLLDGYFQSSRYFASVSGLVKGQITQTPSFSYGWNSMEGSAFIGVQFRRGDYKGVRQGNYHGLLPDHYFFRGVEIARAIKGNLPVIVFSDELEEAERLASLIRGGSAHEVRAGSTALESLGALSRGSAHVISNSSFGWWGAYLSELADLIVVPRPWFRDRRVDTSDLLEPGWISLGF